MPQPKSLSLIEIISRPDGEAPDWVRDAWVGIILESISITANEMPTLGVLSGPKSRIGQCIAVLLGKSVKMNGYVVSAADAVARLRQARPDAADWWATNTPHLFEKGGRFVFPSENCRLCVRSDLNNA